MTIQCIAALTLLWLFWIVLCMYLLLTFNNIRIPQSFPLTTKSIKALPANRTDSSIIEQRDAYVFINVNKKHFLTRFTATITESPNLKLEKKKENQPIVNPAVEKVTKRMKQKTNNKTPDFIIKQAPEI